MNECNAHETSTNTNTHTPDKIIAVNGRRLFQYILTGLRLYCFSFVIIELMYSDAHPRTTGNIFIIVLCYSAKVRFIWNKTVGGNSSALEQLLGDGCIFCSYFVYFIVVIIAVKWENVRNVDICSTRHWRMTSREFFSTQDIQQSFDMFAKPLLIYSKYWWLPVPGIRTSASRQQGASITVRASEWIIRPRIVIIRKHEHPHKVCGLAWCALVEIPCRLSLTFCPSRSITLCPYCALFVSHPTLGSTLSTCNKRVNVRKLLMRLGQFAGKSCIAPVQIERTCDFAKSKFTHKCVNDFAE